MKRTICLLAVVLLSVPVIAADYYVDVKATGANNGTSWTDAWTSLTSAMSSTPAGNTINVAAGTYVAPTDGWAPTNSNLSLIAKTGDDVILSGDTNGDDTFADLLADPCALDAAYTTGDHSDNTRILSLVNMNMTISDVTFKGAGYSSNGAAINIGGTSAVTLNNCLFTQCYSSGKGGCLNLSSTGNVVLNDCKMIQNSSYNKGSLVFANNTGSLTANNCLFQIAVAIGAAGGFYLDNVPEDWVFTDCIFDRCQMCNNPGGSAGIQTDYETSTSITLTNCVFKECMSYHHGAALYLLAKTANLDITANVSNCLITGCTNYEVGGSVVALHGEIRQTNTTVDLNITNCTIADNHTNGQGHIGGWCYTNDATCSVNVNLKNCIVWGNTGDSGNAQLINDTGDSGARVFISANYCCWDNSDPNDWGNAQSLGSNNLLKTDDPTLDPGFEPGLLSAYALSSSSPCIDTGDPTSDYSAEPKCNGGRINMGVYGGTAYATPTASSSKLADLDCDNDVDLGDFSIMSGLWLQ